MPTAYGQCPSNQAGSPHESDRSIPKDYDDKMNILGVHLSLRGRVSLRHLLLRQPPQGPPQDSAKDTPRSLLSERCWRSMAPKLGFLIAVVFAVAATHDVRAFMPPGRAAPSWRATTAGRRHTCSAADSRDIRPATAVHASTTGDNADALATAAAGSSNAEGQEESGVRRWAGIRRSLARGAVSFTAVTLGATALSGLSAEIQQRLGGAVAMPMAMGSAEASVVKPFSKRSVEEKLGNLPAFMVTNAKGSPYLTPTGREGHQVGDM